MIETIAEIKAHFETGDKPTQAQFENLIDTLNASLPSEYRVASGVLRNTGSGWFAIDDIDHSPLNIVGVSNNTQIITVDYSSIGASEVLLGMTTADETYQGQYTFGTSVGVGTTSIRVTPSAAVLSVDVTHTGNGVFTLSSNMTGVGYTYSLATGLFTLTTPTAKGAIVADSWAGQTHIMGGANTLNHNSIFRKFYNLDGTQQTLANPEVQRFTIERKLDISTIINPNDLTNPSGNIWFLAIVKM